MSSKNSPTNNFNFSEDKMIENSDEEIEISFDSDDLFNENLKNKFKMDVSSISIQTSSDISLSNITEDYLNNNEQINEIKYISFMLLFNECKYDDEFSIIMSKKKYNEIKLRQIIIQDINYDENMNKVVFGPKNYSFIQQKLQKGKKVCFEFQEKKIVIHDKNKMELDGKSLLNEKEFSEKYDKIYQNIKNESNNPNNSENENEAIIFYEYVADNKFIRYIYWNVYYKEIDGLFNHHKDIYLNINGKVSITDALTKLKEGKYNADNDLKCNIIFKNFDSKIIEKDTPIALEIKKSFDLCNLLHQIKQDSKILSCARIKNNDEEINLPKYVIGILCSYGNHDIDTELEYLNENYKKEEGITIMEHCLDVFEKMNINVVIGFIDGEQINGYPLGVCDYDIPDLKLAKRVDLYYMNNKICGGKYKGEQIAQINSKYGKYYKSLIFERNIPLSEHNKIVSEVLEKMKEKNAEIISNFEKENKDDPKILEFLNKFKASLEENQP